MNTKDKLLMIQNEIYEQDFNISKALSAMQALGDALNVDDAELTHDQCLEMAANHVYIANMVSIVSDYIFRAHKELEKLQEI